MLTDTRKAIPHVLIDADGNVNEKELNTSTKIRASPGANADKIVETNNEEIARRSKKVRELQEQLEKTAEEHMREGFNQTIDEEMDIIAQLKRANEEIEQ